MANFIKKLLVLFLFFLQLIPAQWHKVNFSYHEAEYLTSVIQYKNKIFVGDFTKGVLYSEDFCKSWKALNSGLTDLYGTFYIINFYSDSTGLYVLNHDGIYKLDQEINHWQQFANIPGVISLAKLGGVFIGGVSGSGVYISTDNGNTWTLNYLTAGMIWNAKSLVVLNDKFFASGDYGVHFTSDNGFSWNNVLNTNTSQILLESDTLYAAASEGIKYSVNEGNSWTDLGPQILYIKCIEKYKVNYFSGGDFAIKYYKSELTDWIPATRNSPDGFFNQVQFLKIINDTLYSCNYGGMYRRALDDFNYPELNLPDSISDEYYNKEVGDETYISFAIGNYGFDTLKIYDVISSNPDFEILRRQMDIPPEWGYGVNLTYKFTDPGKRSTQITVISNDTIAKNIFVVELEGLPIEFELKQNFPNPFNPDTKINYIIPSTQFTSLKVYNSLGELVQVLVNEIQDGGRYSITFDASVLSAGVYFYQIISGSNNQTKKMIYLK